MAAIPLNVLIAEDHDPTFRIFQIHVNSLNLNLVRARNGAEAVRLYQERPEYFDLVLMDVEMPEIDGIEATRRIRAFERERGARRTDIIALTAHDEDEYIVRFNECGMDSLLEKPYKPAVIAKVISKYREQKEKSFSTTVSSGGFNKDELHGAISNVKHQLWSELSQNAEKIATVCDSALPENEKRDAVLLATLRFKGFGGHLSHLIVVDAVQRLADAAAAMDFAQCKQLAGELVGYAVEQQQAHSMINARKSSLADVSTPMGAEESELARHGSAEQLQPVDVDEDMRAVMMAFRSMFVADVTETIARIKGALAQSPPDFQTIRRLGHVLKGTGGNLGHVRVTELGHKVNTAAIDAKAETIAVLVDELDKYVEAASNESEFPEQIPAAPAVTPAIRPEGHLRSTADDALLQFNRTVKASYVKSLPAYVDDLVAAFEKRDLAAVGEVAEQLHIVGGRLGDGHINEAANSVAAGVEAQDWDKLDNAIQVFSSYLDHIVM